VLLLIKKVEEQRIVLSYTAFHAVTWVTTTLPQFAHTQDKSTQDRLAAH